MCAHEQTAPLQSGECFVSALGDVHLRRCPAMARCCCLGVHSVMAYAGTYTLAHRVGPKWQTLWREGHWTVGAARPWLSAPDCPKVVNGLKGSAAPFQSGKWFKRKRCTVPKWHKVVRDGHLAAAAHTAAAGCVCCSEQQRKKAEKDV
eukprot:scaffold120299_cov21-Tisochrysis_lutea.AAC.1